MCKRDASFVVAEIVGSVLFTACVHVYRKEFFSLVRY